jgi:polyisoprenoid-binding protein YceI
MKRFLAALLVVAGAASPLCAASYKIDPDHSSINFTIAHLTISKVHGRFDKFSGTIEYEPGKMDAWKTEASIETASVNTSVEARDKHLRSPDFFNVEKFPVMTFKSTKISGVKDMKGKLTGDFTFLGVTKPVVLDVEGYGPVKDPWGNERVGATAKGKINRKDFGMVWNKSLDTGGLMIGDEVEIVLEIEAVKEKPKVAPAQK